MPQSKALIIHKVIKSCLLTNLNYVKFSDVTKQGVMTSMT